MYHTRSKYTNAPGLFGGNLIGCALIPMVLTSLIGCDQRELQEHTIRKGVERVPEPRRSETPEVVNQAPFPWKAPENWELDETPRAMRIATYHAPDPEGSIEIAVT
ncbi:MAG: hypothetical protein KDK91_02075, partial [Gammaproteobacteria bacterium]|nr:hypothetical protein [Gammaproteobacteria bacterium]